MTGSSTSRCGGASGISEKLDEYTTTLAHPDANIDALGFATSCTRAPFPLPKGMTEGRNILDFQPVGEGITWQNGEPFQDSRARRFARAKAIIESLLGVRPTKNKSTLYRGQDEDPKKISLEQEPDGKAVGLGSSCAKPS